MSEQTASIDPIDERIRALARIAAGIAVSATTATLQSLTEEGLAAGATAEEIVGTLLAVGPVVGSARLVRAAPELARAVGYNGDAVIENHA